MKRAAWRRSGGSLGVSIAVHALLFAALVQVVFRVPIAELVTVRRSELPAARGRFVAVPAQPGGRPGVAGAMRAQAPASLRAPRVIPDRLPVPAPSAPVERMAGGDGRGLGGAGSGLATGIVPRLPDPRIRLTPGAPIRVQRTVAEDVDSIINVAIGIVRDSMEMEAGKRRPGDWTFERNGEKWGWDEAGIRLGKFTIPNALLALLPLNTSSPMSPIEQRRAAWIRNDILENARRSISEDEFRAAVKRIRERKERERAEQQKAGPTKADPPPRIVP